MLLVLGVNKTNIKPWRKELKSSRILHLNCMAIFLNSFSTLKRCKALILDYITKIINTTWCKWVVNCSEQGHGIILIKYQLNWKNKI